MISFREYKIIRDAEGILCEDNLFKGGVTLPRLLARNFFGFGPRQHLRSQFARSHAKENNVRDFFRRLSANLKSMAGKGLEIIPDSIWTRIKAKMSIPDHDNVGDEEVKKAFLVLKKKANKVSFEEMKMYLLMLNKLLRVNIATNSIGHSVYYNTLGSLIENPSRFMSFNQPEGGWVNFFASLTPIRHASIAAQAISDSIEGTQEEELIRAAVKKTLEEMSDVELRDLVWVDRRTKSGREYVGRILSAYELDSTGLSDELRQNPVLRRRFRKARESKSKFRNRKTTEGQRTTSPSVTPPLPTTSPESHQSESEPPAPPDLDLQ